MEESSIFHICNYLHSRSNVPFLLLPFAAFFDYKKMFDVTTSNLSFHSLCSRLGLQLFLLLFDSLLKNLG